MIWANLLHLSYNMWGDREIPGESPAGTSYFPSLRCETPLWKELVLATAAAGGTMIVVDVGDGVRFESHPELAVRGAWSPARLRRELAAMRKLGLEPIPKLNFSTCHDAWLGPYSRCVSTDAYYAVCRDLIEEVTGLFDTPRFFHLGMDEETASHQRRLEYAVMRQHDLWWRDLYFLVGRVERGGVRSWVWSDYIWDHRDAFLKKMPRTVLQSNWYYGSAFSRKLNHVKAYLDLEAHGYDQVPTGSNWGDPKNFEKTVAYCSKYVDPSRLLGFMQTPWRPTLSDWREVHISAVEQIGTGRRRFERRCAS